MELTLILMGECPRCKREKVEDAQWSSIPFDVRQDMKSAFVRDGGARHLCKSCDSLVRRTNPDELLDYERKTLPVAIFAEEYKTLSAVGTTKQQMARMLGLYRPHRLTESRRLSTFDKALERAKKAGLL